MLQVLNYIDILNVHTELLKVSDMECNTVWLQTKLAKAKTLWQRNEKPLKLSPCNSVEISVNHLRKKWILYNVQFKQFLNLSLNSLLGANAISEIKVTATALITQLMHNTDTFSPHNLIIWLVSVNFWLFV